MARLKEKYEKEVVPKLVAEFGIKNPMAVPRIVKVVCNIGIGEASRQPKLMEQALEELAAITGQKPVVRKARKSIAQFKLRVGMQVGCMVTLRRERMYEFLDRLLNIALPRVRDFRGLSPRGFDGRGNYTLGIKDHLIFPEVDYTKVERPKGMNVTVVTTAETDDQARFLLAELGFPFAKS
ncbi:MAG: 50S ribosomal protein L5 [Acidobacteriota bacterium]|uniref:Large ribosomal subunit protein uL5 n=1 Tax=Thermoanaerobaculum aquaticum TaxID=1312852 RepID=A0A062XYY8_9BACT|nr:50S ribosomal protein L5 [Thermoanaerobaculum aquaticum]KDA54659.1 50S ribosomal protein L5 [Thermoanaerobaculum aquaticum]BCW92952.1 MAG: 50S ribosomal protein L5 [Thermoanaerobaculum sp.]